MDLETYFGREPDAPAPVFGQPGQLTGWMAWGPFELRGRNVLLVDPMHGPDASAGLSIRMLAGTYDVGLRIMEYGPDRRIARLRALRGGKRARTGEVLGVVRCESAHLGLCDAELASAAWQRQGDDAAFSLVQRELRESHLVGFVELDQAAEIALPFVETGFGDGSFRVRELLAGDIRVGFEVELIANRTPYPFSEGHPAPRVD